MDPVEATKQVDRIVASESFRNSDSSRRLLRFLAGESISDHARELKEYTVGVDAFGKPADYDPRSDASTRVQAGKLRQRLEEYYRNGGAGDPVIVRFPKGGFQLFFEPAETPAPPRPWRRLHLGLAYGLAATVLLASLATAYRMGKSQSPASGGAMQTAWTPEMEAFWTPLLDDSSPILISMGMPLFMALDNGITVRQHTLNDFQTAEHSETIERLKKFYASPQVKPVHIYTGEGDATAAFLLARLLSVKKSQLRLKRSHVLDWEDVKNNHMIFLGNQKSQPQLRGFLAAREFEVEGFGVRALHPLAGEPSYFATERNPTSREIEQAYVVVRRLPAGPGGKEIFALSSYSTEGVWAVAEYLTEGRTVRELVQKLRGVTGQMPRAWEALLRVRYKDRVPLQTQYVAHHPI